jgi:uncharacterized protein YecE (DUF72 family)
LAEETGAVQPRWFLGTMGFGYQDWEGVFYPEGLKQRDYLAHYSEFFNTVEMDSTFYGTPRTEYVKRWAAVTPPGFKFCPKMPRAITHEMGLRHAEQETLDFLQAVRHFGEKLGPILIQFPPDFAREEIGLLATFLRQLPDDLRYAVEFRHRSWHATVTGMLLQQHHIGWVSTAYLYMPKRVYVTTDFIYLRWLGRHGTYDTKDHERVDKTPELEQWLADIQKRQQEESVGTIYGFFNDEYAGHAPATTQKMMRLVGLPTKPLTPPQQTRLL